MKTTLKLYDYLLGKCKFEGCEYNVDCGLCSANDISHLDYITRLVDNALNKSNETLKNIDIVCSQINIKNGYCECGERLIENITYVPYGDINVPITTFECVKC